MGEQVKSFSELELVSVDQLSVLIHKSSASIRSDASRNPSTLPPMCRLPGNKRLLWRSEDVREWMALFVVRSPLSISTPKVQVEIESSPRKRGRPRNSERRLGA